MRVFLSGPMRGQPGLNYAAFDAAEATLKARGFEVVNPAAMGRAAGFDGTAPDKAASRPLHLGRNMAALACCDAIALLPGWRQAEGARLEYRAARYLGLDVLQLE